MKADTTFSSSSTLPPLDPSSPPSTAEIFSQAIAYITPRNRGSSRRRATSIRNEVQREYNVTKSMAKIPGAFDHFRDLRDWVIVSIEGYIERLKKRHNGSSVALDTISLGLNKRADIRKKEMDTNDLAMEKKMLFCAVHTSMTRYFCMRSVTGWAYPICIYPYVPHDFVQI